jgi:hypothetical protein
MRQHFSDKSSLPKLTIDELRSFDGLTHLNDAEAEEITDALMQLAMVVYYTNN